MSGTEAWGNCEGTRRVPITFKELLESCCGEPAARAYYF